MELADAAEISRAIQARHIAVPIEDAYTVTPLDDAAAVSREMLDRQFAYAPVVRDDRIVGLFAAEPGVPGTVESQLRPLDASMLVSSDTPLTDVTAYLAEQPFLLMVHGHRFTGFLTPADMGSAPARTHDYLMIAGLEIQLGALIREYFEDQQDAVNRLRNNGRAEQRKRAADQRAADEFLDEVAAMTFPDLLQVCGSVPEFVAAATGGGRSWKWLTRGLGLFRNDVMHPVRELAKATPEGMTRFAAYDERLMTLLRAAETVRKAAVVDAATAVSAT